MGSGPVKGFSVTLAVGIFTTLFSVYFIARLLTSFYVVKNKERLVMSFIDDPNGKHLQECMSSILPCFDFAPHTIFAPTLGCKT